MSVSSINYPTSHHPQLSIFLTCLQILYITKYYNIQKIQNQIHTTFTRVSLQNSKIVKNTLGQWYTNFILCFTLSLVTNN